MLWAVFALLPAAGPAADPAAGPVAGPVAGGEPYSARRRVREWTSAARGRGFLPALKREGGGGAGHLRCRVACGGGVAVLRLGPRRDSASPAATVLPTKARQGQRRACARPGPRAARPTQARQAAGGGRRVRHGHEKTRTRDAALGAVLRAADARCAWRRVRHQPCRGPRPQEDTDFDCSADARLRAHEAIQDLQPMRLAASHASRAAAAPRTACSRGPAPHLVPSHLPRAGDEACNEGERPPVTPATMRACWSRHL